MFLCLHSPSSSAHLEDLKDRLFGALAAAPDAAGEEEPALVASLVGAVRAMDRGDLTTGEVIAAFERHQVPGFTFWRWLAEMLDEGVYLGVVFERAA